MSIAALILSGVAFPLAAADAGLEKWRADLSTADQMKSEGRSAEAERMYQSALDEARRLQPNLAPVAATYHNLAGFYQDAGRYDAAVGAYQRSLELWEKTGAIGRAYLLRTANHLIGLYLERGDIAAAERHHRALIAPRLAGWPGRERDPDVAQALTNLGSIQYQQRRYAEARSNYEAAIAIRQRIADDPPAERGVLLMNLAFALARTGETDRALDLSSRAIPMIESGAGASSPLFVFALVNRAHVLLNARRFSEAESVLDRAMATARTIVGEEHWVTASVMSCYAALLKATNRKKEAAVLDARVKSIRTALQHSADRQTVDMRELSLIR